LFFLASSSEPMSLLNLVSGLRRGQIVAPLVLGLMMLALYGALVWLVRRGHSRPVSCFSPQGLVRNDGQIYSWNDLSRVVAGVFGSGIRHTDRKGHVEVPFSSMALPVDA